MHKMNTPRNSIGVFVYIYIWKHHEIPVVGHLKNRELHPNFGVESSKVAASAVCLLPFSKWSSSTPRRLSTFPVGILWAKKGPLGCWLGYLYKGWQWHVYPFYMGIFVHKPWNKDPVIYINNQDDSMESEATPVIFVVSTCWMLQKSQRERTHWLERHAV